MKNIQKVIRAVKTTSKKHGKNAINNGYKCNLKKNYEKQKCKQKTKSDNGIKYVLLNKWIRKKAKNLLN